ncbi:MAG: DMT family transporter, partial [Oscillospiraceae bacterium]|nr:DMT family transporter [Oscillospiraceae bacterium]
RLALTGRQELCFLLLGLSGCSLYFYTENTALTYTLASNVSIIVAAAPIFTAVLAHAAGVERFRRQTLWGFLAAFTGVVLVVCNGTFVLKLNPRGDLLALGAAACWAVYSVLQRRAGRELDPILFTRRTLFWGAVTAVPLVLLEGAPFPTAPLAAPVVFGNLLFLGLIGSGLCYVLWNRAFRLLGVVATNNFIYLNPFVTIVTARIFLDEPISPLAVVGAALITAGVAVSQYAPKKKAPVK